MKKNVAFTPLFFAVLKRDESVQLPFELSVHIPVKLLLQIKPNNVALTLYCK